MRSHIIDYPSPQKIAAIPIPETVMVYGLLLADSVDFRHLVITEWDGQESSVTRHPWEENPAEMVTELIKRDLEASGLFEKTVDQWSTARYRYALEGKLIGLHGVIKDGKAKAVVEAEMTFMDFDSPFGAKKTIMKKTYKIEVPSVDTTPASIVRAVNLGIRRLSERIRSDVRQALETPNGAGNGEKKPVLPESAVRFSLNGAVRLH